MKIDDNFYMKLAIDEAWKYQLLTYPNPAVGCVVVKDGKLLAIEALKEAGMQPIPSGFKTTEALRQPIPQAWL